MTKLQIDIPNVQIPTVASLVLGGLLGAMLLGTAPNASASTTCTCPDSHVSTCSRQGFAITLVDFQVDQQAGESHWDYQVCNETGLGTGCEPPKDLSHVDLDLPALGSCLTPTQSISLAQLADFDNAVLSCGVAEKDPSCDIFGTVDQDFVAKCDVAGGNLDPGECITMRLTIGGEQPTLGAGGATVVTKAGPACEGDCVLGPSCEPCGDDPAEDGCLTRTPGFWGTHPHITSLFLPVTVCGNSLEVTAAGSCDSATEALCVSPGRESRGNRAYASLVRALTAAKLSLNATAANGGACGSGEVEARIAECEALCGANQRTISGSGCIEDLAAFVESQDTLSITPAPFDRPGPANPTSCRDARGNGLVIGSCGP